MDSFSDIKPLCRSSVELVLRKNVPPKNDFSGGGGGEGGGWLTTLFMSNN